MFSRTKIPPSEASPLDEVTSSSPSLALKRIIGMCYLPSDRAILGRLIQIMIRNQPVDAVTVAMPFYKRAR